MAATRSSATTRGEILAELDRLRKLEVVRLVDLVVVAKDADGELAQVQVSDLTVEQGRGAQVCRQGLPPEAGDLLQTSPMKLYQAGRRLDVTGTAAGRLPAADPGQHPAVLVAVAMKAGIVGRGGAGGRRSRRRGRPT